MIRISCSACLSLLFLLTSAGCTDFVEPNQLAFVIGTGIDYAGDEMIEVSDQIVIPSLINGPSKGGGSGESESAIVISAKGKNVFEATQKIQRKLSRRLMTSHRALIAISEEYMEKHDVTLLFDKLNRDPANNQRDTILMIKGSAKEFLKIKHPLEQLSSIAAYKELRINGLYHFTTREFIMDSATEGRRILVPLLQIEKEMEKRKDKAQLVKFSGYAVLNKELKIKGILNDSEGAGAIWMLGKGTYQGLTIPWKKDKGTLSFRITQLERQIRSLKGNDPTRILLTVKAQAYLLDNTTPLDMSEVDNMIALKKYLNEKIQKDLQETMNKVQQWGPDIFGIGEYLHRKHPYWWKSQRDDWDENFKKINVTVRANVQIRSTGTSADQVK